MMVKLGGMMVKVKQITPRTLVCKRYDAASYHLHARTQVRPYEEYVIVSYVLRMGVLKLFGLKY